jgi:hypothetical protein
MNDQGGWNENWNGGWAETAAASPYREPVAEHPDSWPDDPRGGGRSGGGGIGSGLIGAVIGALLVAVLALGGYVLLTRDGDPVPSASSVSDDDGARAGADPAAPQVGGESAPVEQRRAPAGSTGQGGSDPGSGQGTAPDSGTYSGVVSQRGTRRSDQDFTVVMTFSAQGSSVNYPTLACGGTLAPIGDSGGARVYAETITSGRCDPRGTWYVTRGADRTSLSVEYRSSGSDYVVVGQLTR